MQDVPPQPEAAATGTAGTPLTPGGGKKHREKAPRAKKTGRKKKKTVWIVLAAVVCLLAVAVFAIYDHYRKPTNEEMRALSGSEDHSLHDAVTGQKP